MSRWLRRLGIFVGVIVVAVVALAGYVTTASSKAVAHTYDVALTPLPVVSDSQAVARGAHLARAISKCMECHGADMGGGVVIDDPQLGYVAGGNLTPGEGSVVGGYTDAEFERVIRHGVKRDGHGAMIMPSDDYQTMTDSDVAAIIAFVRSLPPVNRTMPPSTLRSLGKALVAFKQLPLYSADRIDHAKAALPSIVADTTVEYGRYLSDIGGCTGCHGPTLSGGPVPGLPPTTPPASNLTPTGLGQYTDAQIETMLRTGKRPDGSELNEFMPWKSTQHMSELEMRATLKFLRTVTPKEFGGR
jgi:mono/diheme cytochrome c family protein